jgi:hypothetical protein
VKLIRSSKRYFTFRIGRTEKNSLFQLLRLYPLVPPSRHKLSKTAEGDTHEENQKLLEEALAEQRRENRKQVNTMLEKPGRFREVEGVLQFSLTPAQMEWLLQVLNDIRVGAWIALGEPEEMDFMQATKINAPYLMAMHGAGRFEEQLLQAMGVKESLEWGEA